MNLCLGYSSNTSFNYRFSRRSNHLQSISATIWNIAFLNNKFEQPEKQTVHH
jgi:hypothetical protein